MTQYAFFFDQSRCDNCHTCVVACRDWYDIQPGPVKWLRVLQQEKGEFPNVFMNVVFATCYHCENPVCADACPNHAIFKEDKYGAVLVDPDLCKGARQCWIACPYGATQFEDNAPGTPMSKCTMCLDRLERGEIPICVASCPARALDFGPLEELEKKYGTLKALDGMPSADLAHPAIVFKPAPAKQKLVPYDEQEALRLLQKRGEGLPDVFSGDPLTAPETYDGLVGYTKLVMKAGSVEENLATSKNEDG